MGILHMATLNTATKKIVWDGIFSKNVGNEFKWYKSKSAKVIHDVKRLVVEFIRHLAWLFDQAKTPS